jgi:peptide/nickel transport system substrate-binding protein
MKSPKFLITATAAAVTMSLGLVACGGGDDDTGGGGGSGSAAKFDQGSTSVVRPSDKKGGTIRFGMSDDFDSTDPANMYYAFAIDFARNYSRTLTTYVSKPGQEGVKFTPDLAESLGAPSDGNKTWTYKLKKGIKYEDGSEVKAADIKYAVARTFDRGVLGKGPSYFTQLLDAGDYKGPFKDKNLDNFKGVTTPDDYTVVFHLKNPFPEMDQLVGFVGQTAPVPQAKDKGAQYAQHPISTGPYMFQGNYEPKKGGTLVPNPNWDASTDPNRKQLAAKLTVEAGIETNEVDNRLLTGSLDIDLAGTGVQAAARQKILTDPKLKANADNPLAGFHWYIPINTKNIPNIECRKAIVYAADRDSMYRAYGGDIGGQLSTSVQPPGVEGRQKGTDFYTQATPGYKGDVAKAKAALQACGQPNGFSTTMVYRSDRDKEKATAEALQQALARVGIKLTLKGFPSGTYTGEQFGSPAFVKKEKIGLGTYGWAPDWPTGYGYLQPISDGKAIVDSGNSNPEELNDPQVNKMWNDVVKVNDPAQRAQIYNQIDQRIREQAAILPNVYAKSLIYRPANLTNVYFHSGYGLYDYANLGVTQ